MLRIVLLLFLTTCSFGAHIKPDSERIIGGYIAEEGQFPYQASIWDAYSTYLAGGSILNEYWVLTAVEYIIDQPAERRVVAVGSNKLRPSGVQYNVAEIHWHEEYHPIYRYNDVGLLKLVKPIKFDDNTQPISLATAPSPIGTSAVFSGWGKQGGIGGVHPNDLRYINLNIIECGLVTQFCTIHYGGGGAALNGDIGSPLVVDGKQIGLLSIGGGGLDDVFSNLYLHVDWINNKINQ